MKLNLGMINPIYPKQQELDRLTSIIYKCWHKCICDNHIDASEDIKNQLKLLEEEKIE